VIALEAELREHKQQTSSAKNKYTDWNTELQKKLKELKEEKKAWVSEAATLRGAKNEAKVCNSFSALSGADSHIRHFLKRRVNCWQTL
jgi:chromosome segregation ATPase